MIDQTKENKILIVAAASLMVLAFRTDLIRKFQNNGYKVGVVAFDNIYAEKIKNLGVEFYYINDNNRSTNPFKILSLKKKYVKIIKSFKPDVVFTFMLKPNIFATLAAKKASVKNVFSMVEGAGDVFVNNGLKSKVIRAVVCHLYRRSFKHVEKVFFLNNDDKYEFVGRRLVKEDCAQVINGIGVNLDKFKFSPVTKKAKFLMVSRLVETKGVIEYCKCAKEVKKLYPDAVFDLVGGEGALKKEDIKEYIDDGSIVYHGETNDVMPYLEGCSVFVLPTYREGFPVSVMEAQSVGRVVIISNAVGCKATVKDGYNGFFVPVKDVNALKDKCIYFIENPEKAVEMGKNAREFAQENFDQKKINQQLFEIIERV